VATMLLMLYYMSTQYTLKVTHVHRKASASAQAMKKVNFTHQYPHGRNEHICQQQPMQCSHTAAKQALEHMQHVCLALSANVHSVYFSQVFLTHVDWIWSCDIVGHSGVPE